MKFGYAIVLALVALVAVTGFASADRLPQQVPENQIFTIDTLIDVTGAVSQEAEMQWTIDSQNAEFVGAIFDTNSQEQLIDAGYSLTTAEYNYLKSVAQSWATTYGTSWTTYLNAAQLSDGNWYIKKFNVPKEELTTKMEPVINADGTSDWGSMDFAGFLDLMLLDTENYDYVSNEGKVLGNIHDSKLYAGEEIAILTWTDSLRSNGGKLALNMNLDFDSQNKGKGLSNLEVEKVLTYASTEGAHLVGAEEWTLDVAGNWEKTADSIRCVFASSSSSYFPAFCNVVKAKSELVNINSAQISTKGAARAVAATGDIPAMLNYQIAVTPDSNSGSGFADGTVKTLFGGSIMEARGKNQVPSATNNWKDTASVTGGIKNFQKTFAYESGFKF
ncbi:hypothetical protein [Methanospirillum hungatei]|uniref:hypothetical protein n=1 Tax=Methanospirillum hungatei TaxID=2203 RepID=UPI0026E92B76|nr:hypothetical protein [Methanospirillum hungatei]MCA1916840.1 hypothetical protein [Methanospirillum hungatei]